MVPRTFILGLVLSIAPVGACRADVITGAPPGGPVTLHTGSFSIDVNGDGAADVTIFDRGEISGPDVTGCEIDALMELNGGTYRGSGFGPLAVALSSGQQVGPSFGIGTNFMYSEPGILVLAIIRSFGPSSTDGAGDPTWIDGQHHFLGLDLPSGADHHYAWIELSLSDSGAPTVGQPWYDTTIYRWAYETQANAPVTIPEPSPLGIVCVVSLATVLVRPRETRSGSSTAEIERRVPANGLATGTAVRIGYGHIATGRA